jgi:hypothetical protein
VGRWVVGTHLSDEDQSVGEALHRVQHQVVAVVADAVVPDRISNDQVAVPGNIYTTGLFTSGSRSTI